MNVVAKAPNWKVREGLICLSVCRCGKDIFFMITTGRMRTRIWIPTIRRCRGGHTPATGKTIRSKRWKISKGS
ncbi:MAG: hypothetical protein PHG35_02025 [Dehalococcoidales bacterium]|nr:hypothetical protein [Dehalococcoidales bacterium]